MSILIKDMKMPTARDTLVLVKTDGTAIVYEDEAYVTTAVSVPPHGDLTDRDAYRDEFMNGVYELCSDDPDNCRANAIIDLFDSAPIVSPADPPKEEA